MKNYALLSAMLLGVCLCGTPVEYVRANEHYVFDKKQTSIRFDVSNFGLFDITGVFSEYDGDFVFCADHPEKDRVSLILYARGIHDTSGEPDEDLQGPHFFNAQVFPRIEFSSTKVHLIDENNADVEGNLTLLGVTRPVTFTVHFLTKDSDGDGDADYVVSFSASATINRSDFGMDYLGPFIVGDDVHLYVDVRGVEADEAHPKKTRKKS